MIYTEHHIFPGIYYIHKVDHRNGSSQKSQWKISDSAERKCFKRGFTLLRCNDHSCWGLHFRNKIVSYLGVTKSAAPEKRKLFVAKFIDSNENNKWHGYPADHVLNQQDIPPENVLRIWLENQYLRPAIIRKLSKGQKCKL